MCRMKAQMYKLRLKRAGTCHSHAANENQSPVDRETQQTNRPQEKEATYYHWRSIYFATKGNIILREGVFLSESHRRLRHFTENPHLALHSSEVRHTQTGTSPENCPFLLGPQEAQKTASPNHNVCQGPSWVCSSGFQAGSYKSG